MNHKTINLKVRDVCGVHCVGMEDGISLFEQILPILQSGGKACLDFTDVLTVTSSFLNASIGKLFGQFKDEDLEKRVTWKALDDTDTQLVHLVIRNAKEHFAKPENTQLVEDNIVRRVLGED